jgi:hypothetical protein
MENNVGKLGDENFEVSNLSTDNDRLKTPEEFGIFQLVWKNDNK